MLQNKSTYNEGPLSEENSQWKMMIDLLGWGEDISFEESMSMVELLCGVFLWLRLMNISS